MTLKLNFIGDIMLGGEFSQNYDQYRDIFVTDDLKKWLGSDPIFANLEAAASNRGGRISNKISVYTKKEPLEILSKLNIKCVSLANNHIMDFGLAAANDTKQILDGLEVAHTGCGSNLAEALRPVVLNHNGHKIVFHAFSWTSRFLEKVQEASASNPGVAPAYYELIKQSLTASKKKFPQAIQVISLHWGEGMVEYPRPDQVEFARSLSEIGVDIIFGHHPHCIQGVEVFRNTAIIYSAGNFIASSYNRTPDKMLTYGDGWRRNRFRRERKVAVFKLEKNNVGQWTFRIKYFKQNPLRPILEDLNSIERFNSAVSHWISSKLLSLPFYSAIFPFIRRLNEITRLIDEIQTRNGLLKSVFKFKSYGLVLKRIIKSEDYH
ncbi:MAG: CapA family protein [Alphaproteobacteria bacterium]|nr:CapA family protein [Alphaproteobacteria bacterium]